MPNVLFNELLKDAVLQGDHTAALACLKEGANPNYRLDYGRYTKPLLFMSVERKDPRMLKLLLIYGGDPNISYEYNTLLSWCISYRSPELVKVALQEEADLSILFDNRENNALTLAVDMKESKISEILVKEIFKIAIIKYQINCGGGELNEQSFMEEVFEVSGMRGEIFKTIVQGLYAFAVSIVAKNHNLLSEFIKEQSPVQDYIRLLLGIMQILEEFRVLDGKDAQSKLRLKNIPRILEEVMIISIEVVASCSPTFRPAFQNYEESIGLLNHVNIKTYERLYQNWLLLPEHYDALSLTPLTDKMKETIMDYLENMPLNGHYKFLITEWFPLPTMFRVVSETTGFPKGVTSFVMEYATDNLPLASAQRTVLFGYGSKKATLCEIKDDEPEMKANVSPTV